jgi:hypothetical protein
LQGNYIPTKHLPLESEQILRTAADETFSPLIYSSGSGEGFIFVQILTIIG